MNECPRDILMTSYPHIESAPNVRSRNPCIEGTRIEIRSIYYAIEHGDRDPHDVADDFEIEDLEQRIEEWEKTKQLEGILASIDTGSPREAFSAFSETVENELVDDEDVTYLMRYVDENGQEQVRSIRTHPNNVDEVDNDVEVTQYKRISSVDEVFE